MNKKTLFTTFIAILFILSIFMINTVNAETIEIENAKVETLTGGTIAKNEQEKKVTITLTAEQINDLVWYEKDAPTYQEDLTRPGNGWWIGFKLTLPSGVDPQKVTRDVTNVFGQTDSKSFNADDDNPNACSYWLGIDENRLNGKTEEFTLGTYKFHWDDKDTTDLTVIIRVDPEGVKLTKDPDKVATVKINDTIFTLLKGKNLTADKDKGGLTQEEVEKLNKLLEPEEGYKFVGLFDKTTSKKIDLEEAVSGDLILETRFEKIEMPDITPNEPDVDEPTGNPAPTDQNQTQKPEDKVQDTTPKTGSDITEAIFLEMATLAIIGVAIVKKYSK